MLNNDLFRNLEINIKDKIETCDESNKRLEINLRIKSYRAKERML